MGGSGAQGGEDLVDHPGRLEETLDERKHVLPERVDLLEVVHEGSEDTWAVDPPTPHRLRLGCWSSDGIDPDN